MSVIIPTYNEKDSLLKCLYSFFHQNLDPDQLEVVVVDGGSGDGTIEALSRLNPSCTFRHFVLPRNGKASAANFGITEASGKFILLSSPNIPAKDDLVSQYLKSYEYPTYENTPISLTVVCNRILSNYYYYKGIYKEICRIEGEDWLKNFVDREKIAQMLKEAIFKIVLNFAKEYPREENLPR